MGNRTNALKHGRILWDYHTMRTPIEKSDFILALGSHDIRPAAHAADLYHANLAPLIVVSGGLGKVTKHESPTTEAARYERALLDRNVPSSAIIKEPTATNTGDNFVKSEALLAGKGIPVKTGIIVTKPYMSRRAYATGSKQWSSVQWQVSPPPISFDDYPNDEVPFDRMLNLMVGDLQRLTVYAERGFQIPQVVPEHVKESCEALVEMGYDQFVVQ